MKLSTATKTFAHVLIALILVTMSTRHSFALTHIDLHERARVDSATITLGQVADLSGTNPEEIKFLEALRLGRSPKVDSANALQFNKERVTLCLALANFQRGQYILTGPDTFFVRRVTKVFHDIPHLEVDLHDFGSAPLPQKTADIPALVSTESSMRSTLSDQERNALYSSSGGYEWNLQKINDAVRAHLLEQLNTTNELIKIKLSTPPSSSAQKRLQNRIVITGIRIKKSEKKSKTVVECYIDMLTQPFSEINKVDRSTELLKFKINQLKNVVVATKNLARGTVLTENNIKLAALPARNAKDAITDINAVIGLQINVALHNGMPLQQSSVNKKTLIHRRDTVTFHYYQSSTIETGKALSDAALGEQVQVECTRGTKKIILIGRVTDENNVSATR